MNYRHEWKHEISASDLTAIRQRLRAAAKPDGHAADGRYLIRSLYFDTPADTALREKLDGVNRREKFRLRCYDRDLSLIRLEKKSKRNALCGKQTALISEEEVHALLQGCPSQPHIASDPLIWELYQKMRTTGLRPKTIVEYTREAYVFGPGNVRVTLDSDIRTGLGGTGFLNPACLTVPVPNSPIILEVKWDAFLPDLIRDAIQLEGRHTASYSKYAACRAYG